MIFWIELKNKHELYTNLKINRNLPSSWFHSLINIFTRYKQSLSATHQFNIPSEDSFKIQVIYLFVVGENKKTDYTLSKSIQNIEWCTLISRLLSLNCCIYKASNYAVGCRPTDIGSREELNSELLRQEG